MAVYSTNYNFGLECLNVSYANCAISHSVFNDNANDIHLCKFSLDTFIQFMAFIWIRNIIIIWQTTIIRMNMIIIAHCFFLHVENINSCEGVESEQQHINK